MIGLGGYSCSGKDAVADILVRDHGFHKTYMSKPLEQALLTLDPIVECRYGTKADSREVIKYSELHSEVGYEKSKKNFEVRRLLQVLGTEIGRKMFGKDCWVNLVFGEIEEWLQDGQDVVVTGIRYHNELQATRDWDGYSLWVDRPGVQAVNSHSSDNSLKMEEFSGVIDNSGDLDDLAHLISSDLLPNLRSLGSPAYQENLRRYVGCSDGYRNEKEQ